VINILAPVSGNNNPLLWRIIAGETGILTRSFQMSVGRIIESYAPSDKGSVQENWNPLRKSYFDRR
jgi:hypothetical protein